MRHLQLKGNIYRFRIGIPTALQRHFDDKKFYVRSLQTGDVSVAKQRRDIAEREVEGLFADCRKNGTTTTVRDAIRELGETWARELAESRKDAIAWTAKVFGKDERTIRPDEISSAEDFIAEQADQIEREQGEEARSRFLNEAFGRVEVGHHQDAYLNEIKLAPKTIRDRRGHLNKFARWVDAQGLSLADIDRKAAGRYFTAELAAGDRWTARKHLSSLKGYWDYLSGRGHVAFAKDDNPWERQMLPDRRRRVERGARANDERPFTEAEIKRLFYAPKADRARAAGRGFGQQIDDAMRIAALSGMRLAEIITLWCSECDVDAGFFSIGHGKTAAAVRRVPIHPDLTEIVRRRTKDKQPDDWLFHELKDERDPGDTFGKRFGRYRERLGVDDQREGKRRSLVNFHSFRRWFVTEAERAGQPESTIAFVVGHAEGRKGITFGTYSRGPSDAQMRACVEAVRLPTVENANRGESGERLEV
ncbi:tyrosine-type recombinase/integrase [Breoghania sp.]|uniref:tyrosine-type recombinase/integrase n=1 Tax=Breoghania sp. TaxID=2065378 RepID=UPI002AA9099F|nr:tyrosine-type recombinase/integrase [Breoghania sp.]